MFYCKQYIYLEFPSDRFQNLELVPEWDSLKTQPHSFWHWQCFSPSIPTDAETFRVVFCFNGVTLQPHVSSAVVPVIFNGSI